MHKKVRGSEVIAEDVFDNLIIRDSYACYP